MYYIKLSVLCMHLPLLCLPLVGVCPFTSAFLLQSYPSHEQIHQVSTFVCACAMHDVV